MNIFTLTLEPNPHHPSSRWEIDLMITTSMDEIMGLYNKYPKYHYQNGKSEPKVILKIKNLEVPWKHVDLETILASKA